jgi:DNA-binding transcriptional regulator YiaG
MGEGVDGRVPGRTHDAEESRADGVWTPERVQRLRADLGLSQAELAARVGTRQQTISEWETGTRAPRRMSRRLLRMVAEASGLYEVTRPDEVSGRAAPEAAPTAEPTAKPTAEPTAEPRP